MVVVEHFLVFHKKLNLRNVQRFNKKNYKEKPLWTYEGCLRTFPLHKGNSRYEAWILHILISRFSVGFWKSEQTCPLTFSKLTTPAWIPSSLTLVPPPHPQMCVNYWLCDCYLSITEELKLCYQVFFFCGNAPSEVLMKSPKSEQYWYKIWYHFDILDIIQ